jgi:uncharacterized protein
MRPSRASSRRQVFVDSSGYLAIAYSRDHYHSAARAIAARLYADRWQFVTSNFVAAETHALLLSRVNRIVAATVLRQIDASPTILIRVTVENEQRARAIIAQYDDKDFSLTDATSFAVMERLGIAWAFSFDRNFTQYGWTLLAP